MFNTDRYGVDINVTGVWLEGITGKGVTVAIPDDGLDHSNEDLAPNYNANASYDFNSESFDPKPKLPSDMHGTRCAGEVAAARNTLCGIGVAYESNISGLQFLSSYEPWIEGRALTYKPDVNHIYSCSWGPADDGNSIEGISYSTYSSIIRGINEGRNGLGSIYVFGSGNGGYYDDCNYDGYANSPYTITIAAIDAEEKRFIFSEPCPCVLASTYSGGSNGRIYTTDVGTTECTSRHTGTSASTPIAAGIVALVLSVRPDLTWRDVQALIVKTAIPFNMEYPGWEKLPSERHYNNYFGFGKLDAYVMVQQAKTFQKLNSQTIFSTQLIQIKKKFSESNGHITSTFYIHGGYPAHYNFKNLEYVCVSIYYKHQNRGHLEFNITSPSGVTSQLAHRRSRDKLSGSIYWTFMTVKHWGESIVGNWTIDVEDKKDQNLDGEVFDWQLHFFGESFDSNKVPVLSFPFISRYPTTTPPPEPTTTLPPTPSSTSSSRPPPPAPQPQPQPEPEPEPEQIPPRPTPPRPTSEPQPEQKPTSIASSTTSTNLISPAPTSSSSKTEISTTQKVSSTTTASTLPSPTQGTSTESGTSRLSFFKKKEFVISIVIVIILIFGLLFLLIGFLRKRTYHTDRLPITETLNDESDPNISQETEKAAMLKKPVNSFDISDTDDSDLHERRALYI